MPYIPPSLQPTSSIPKPFSPESTETALPPTTIKEEVTDKGPLGGVDEALITPRPTNTVPSTRTSTLRRMSSTLSISPPLPSPSHGLANNFAGLAVGTDHASSTSPLHSDVPPGPTSSESSHPADIPSTAEEDDHADPTRRPSTTPSVTSTASLPSLESDHPDPHSASSSSLASLNSNLSSPVTPATTADPGTPSVAIASGGAGDDRSDGIARYREGLYAYTRGLYLEAKLSSTKAEKRRTSISSSANFGVKQSGMERLAAKKALAKRMNA